MSTTVDRSAAQSTLNVWQMAQRQLDNIAEIIGLDASIHGYLREPKRVLSVSVPVRMDSGEHRVFEGYRVQHNMSRGPGKGAGDVDVLEVRSCEYPLWRCQRRRHL